MTNKAYKELEKALLDQQKSVRASRAEAEKLLLLLGLSKSSGKKPARTIAR